MKKYALYFLLSIFLGLSCNDKTDSEITGMCRVRRDSLILKFPKLRVKEIDNNKLIRQLDDKTNDSLLRGSYYFYPNGMLKSYKFFSLPNTYQYNEEYDSLGKVSALEGKPIVLKLFREIDSSVVKVGLFFFSLNKAYENIYISTQSGVEFPVQLSEDTIFSNMKSVYFRLPKIRNHDKIFIESSLINTCTGEKWKLRDTSDLKY